MNELRRLCRKYKVPICQRSPRAVLGSGKGK